MVPRRLLLLVVLAFGTCWAQSGAPATICDNLKVDETDFRFQTFAPGLAKTPTNESTTLNCVEDLSMAPNSNVTACFETTIGDDDKECTVVKFDGQTVVSLNCTTLGQAEDETKIGTFKSTGSEDIDVNVTVVGKTDATSRCTTVSYQYSHASGNVSSGDTKVCSCLDKTKLQAKRLAPIPTDLCNVTKHGADAKLVKNNANAAPMEHCSTIQVNGAAEPICIKTKRQEKFKECTTITIKGAPVDDLGIECEKLGDEFTGTPFDARKPGNRYAGYSGFKNCTTYEDITLCVESITEPEGKCVTVAAGANEASATKKFSHCFCLKLNEYLVETLKTGDCSAGKTVEDDDIQIHYVAKNPQLPEGFSEFDNSYINNKPVDVELGSVQFMRGWDMALVGMCVGEVRRVTIPRKHYMSGEILTYPGKSPHPLIHEDDTLEFEILLVKIVGDKTEL